MTRRRIHGGIAGLAALSLALGSAGPALAKPVDDPSAPNIQHPQTAGYEVVNLPTVAQPGGDDSAWPYVAIGGGAVGLAVAGVGGAMAVSQRHHRRHRRSGRSGPTVAA